MNGTPPLETAVVAVVPRYPGAADSAYVGFIVAYDAWRRRPERIYAQPLPGPIPLSPDAALLGSGREAAVFSALRDDGTRVAHVVGIVNGRIRVLEDETAAGLVATLPPAARSEEHTSELQSPDHLVCRLLLEKKKKKILQFKQT